MAETAAAALTGSASATPIDPKLAAPEKLTPATDVAASGALIEPGVVKRVDTAHPAVDDNPRKNTRVIDNTITFNDPTVPGHVQAARNLGMANDYDAPKEAPAAAAQA